MAQILGVQTINGIWLIETDTDPSLTGGVAAPIGSFGSANDGSGTFYKSGVSNTDWYRLTQSNDFTSQNLLLVRKNPTQGQYATIEDALNAITTNSDTNPFVISVGVGIFEENQINCKPYVSIVGTSIQDTIIKPLGNHDLFVVTDVMTEISFMSLQNVPAGKAAIFCNDCGDYFQAHKLNFVDCDINVKVYSATQDTVAYLEYVDYNGAMTYGNHITSTGGFKATLNTENYYTFPSSSGFIADLITGTNATLIITSSGIYGTESPNLPPVVGNFGVICENGAIVRIIGSTISGFQVGIKNNNVGAGCYIDLNAIDFDDNTSDIIIEHPSTDGGFIGTSDLSKISVDPASSFTCIFSQPNLSEGGFVVTGDFYNGAKISQVAEVTTLIHNQALGLISGALSDGGGFQVDISSGLGYLLDGNVLKKITWGNTSVILAANQTKYIYFNNAGVLSTSDTAPVILQNILLGRVNTNGTNIQFIDKTSYSGNHTANRLTEVIREVFGSLYYFGTIFSENVTPYKLDVTNGEYYYGVNEFNPSGGSAITFDKYYRDGSGGWIIIDGVDLIPNDKYDDGSGTLQNMTAGYYAKGLMYIVGDGVNERYFFVYPQSEYALQVDAENAPLPTPPTYFTDGVTRVASFVVQQGAGNIITILSERPLPVTQSSASAPISSHLALTDLNTGNAGHNQFYMLNGSTPLAADMNMAGYNVLNGGTFNSVVVQAHASRHLPNGADPLSTAAPTTNLSGTSTNSVGIQNSFARSDHSHAITGAALTKVDDTNITLTLGGSFNTALLNTASLTLGWTGTLSVARGGTGAGNANDALNNLLPSQTGNNGKVLTTDGTNTTWNTIVAILGYTPVNKAGDSGVGLITFLNNQGIDVDLSGGTDTLNIGTSNADIINIGYSGSTINIIGTLSYQNVDNLQVKDKLFTVNKGGGVGSGASAGFEIEEGGAITGWFATSGTRDGWDFKAPAITSQLTLSLSALTSSRILTAPNVTGVIATTNGGQTFTSAIWNGSTIDAIYGGTGNSIYAVGDILYADTTTTLGRLADVATGNALISGGVGVAPSWGKIGLTTHVSGILPIANGGTSAATALAAFNNLSPLTTKGDIVTHDGTNNIRLPIGSNTQVFISDSAQASGNRWGDVFSSILTPAAFAATQNNYNPAGLSDANVLRLTSTGAQSVTGIVAPASTKTLVVFNIGASNITFVDASAGSTAANRFQMNGNTLLNPNEGAIFWYDVTTQRWRCAGRAL